ncbi:uncharacterized protein LOC120357200 [Solenopsis invicta]|uniref:uncharacterized protein LOC120357200 n=1 Tax=Solenopsis invicta TaxID=13686 RepID=UPI00193D10A0|nr:uncharacterized protein LOC120357200 [Solenopsis invicta]
MIKLLTTTKRLHELQDIALAHVADNTIREASILSSQFDTQIYIYHFPGNREIRSRNLIYFGNEKIYYLMMKNDRIAADNAICLSVILPKNKALDWFDYFKGQIGLSVSMDKTDHTSESVLGI